MKYVSVFLFSCLIACNSFADSGSFQPSDTFQTADEILNREPDNTPCATSVFSRALATNANMVSESDSEDTVQQWIQSVFAKPDVLRDVLNCPEFQSIDETDSIKLQPIKYTFPGGREIVVNYETQPKILKQRIELASKRDINSLNDDNPQIGAIGDTSVWTNTDPAWYAIMVVQRGALDNFVGPDKNNTISLRYIENNINSLYPRNSSCTDKSALAGDKKPINQATTKTVGLEEAGEKDTNDYYVAGDVNLHWIAYTEIALDVVITVATMGGGAAISGATKAARASRAFKGLTRVVRGLDRADTLARLRKYQRLEKELNQARQAAQSADKIADLEKQLKTVGTELRKIDKLTDTTKFSKEIEALEKATLAVQDYINLENKLTRSNRAITRIKKYQEVEKELSKLDKVRDYKKYMEKSQELTKLSEQLRDIDKISDTSHIGETLNRLQKEVATIEKDMSAAASTNKDVAEYAKAKQSMREINEYLKAYNDLKGVNSLRKTAKTGNVATRVLNFIKASSKVNKNISRGAKLGRASTLSGRVRDWLFNSTLKNAGALGRLEAKGGALYAAIKFAGDMYDWAETSTGDYTNGIEFKPLLLLSADDIKGQENVVNYGMWLMWEGDATSATGDDAAFLQAMDFAEKFYSDLVDTMDETNNHACDVDIYVVRPVLRNPDKNPELYYLIMNDIPWSTAK